MAEWFWRVLAWVVTLRPLNDWIVTRALRTPLAELRDAEGNVRVRRWWLFNPGPWCPFRAQVHMVLGAEAGPYLHRLPWSTRTIVLAGSYTEKLENGEAAFRGVGDTAALRLGQFHRIVAVDSLRGAVTLSITGRERGSRGFLVPYREPPPGCRK